MNVGANADFVRGFTINVSVKNIYLFHNFKLIASF